MKHKHITRYTYKTASFKGWRVSFSRMSNVYVRYFSDSFYGSENAALDAAIQVRDALLGELKQTETAEQVREVFAKYKKDEEQITKEKENARKKVSTASKARQGTPRKKANK